MSGPGPSWVFFSQDYQKTHSCSPRERDCPQTGGMYPEEQLHKHDSQSAQLLSLCCACLKYGLFSFFEMGSEFGRGPSGNQIWLWASGPGFHRDRYVTEDSKPWPPGSAYVLGGSDKQVRTTTLQRDGDTHTETHTHPWKKVAFVRRVVDGWR